MIRKTLLKSVYLWIWPLLLLFAGCGRTFWLNALETDIRTVNLKQIPDGSYEGEFESGVKVRVRVEISGHQLRDIRILEHRTQLGRRAEKITDRVIRDQSLNVDAVTGATLSSVCILKAIENALLKGMNP